MSFRIGIIGDTQGRFKVDALMDRVAQVFAGVDEVWHAGDWQYPEILDGLARIAPLTVVNGNAPDDPRYPERVLRHLEGVQVGMVHRAPHPGTDWVKGLDICIHGHSHKWRDEVVDGVRYINVSTPTAAGFSRDRTCGMLLIDGIVAQLERVEF
ncbi:MAG TPA: metallophosphoesterase family protein [Candidatus Dormibacteraeota bacterium]|nr:metallophosphoesterase family protein [Candidatus Dormibacteraeota bacterium]